MARYAHIYHHQYKEMEKLELHAHLNHVFKRFILFNMVPAGTLGHIAKL